MTGPTGYPAATTSPPRTPLWVWVVGIAVVGTALAMIVSMTVPMLMGGMGGGGH